MFKILISLVSLNMTFLPETSRARQMTQHFSRVFDAGNQFESQIQNCKNPRRTVENLQKLPKE